MIQARNLMNTEQKCYSLHPDTGSSYVWELIHLKTEISESVYSMLGDIVANFI